MNLHHAVIVLKRYFFQGVGIDMSTIDYDDCRHETTCLSLLLFVYSN
jgi:hypothetical protein